MRNLLRFIASNYFILLFLFLEGLAILLMVQFNAFQRSGFMSVSRNVTGGIYRNMQGIRNYTHLRHENNILMEENARLQNQLNSRPGQALIIMGAYSGIDTITETDLQKYRYIPAKVVNNSLKKQFNYLTLNRGVLHGLEREMGVVAEQGVVGILLESSANYSTVLPVINRDFRLSAKIKRNGYFGIVEWDGMHPMFARLREIPNHVQVQTGDTIVTSGYSAIFPEGIPVGLVDSVTHSEGNYHDVRIRLAVDFGNLHHVSVIRNLGNDEQKELEGRIEK